MNLKERFFNPYGLRTRLSKAVVISVIVSIIVLLVLNFGFDYLLTNYYEHLNIEQVYLQQQYKSLQKYIDEYNVSTNNLSLLKEWEKRRPIILLELHVDDKCIYSSFYDTPESILIMDENMELSDGVDLTLKDSHVTAYIYSDFIYLLSLGTTIISVGIAIVLFITLYFYNIRKLLRYICHLNEDVQILEGGNLDYNVLEEGNDEITDLARSINRMKTTIQQQLEIEQKHQEIRKQMITEMSHDLRTPLTSILLYIEIVRSHRYESEEQLQDYLEKIDNKARNMKLLSDHLFEYSIQDSEKKQFELKSMKDIFGNTIISMADDLKEQGFSVKLNIEWGNCYVQVNPEYIERIFENIVSNIEKYAEKNEDIIIEALHIEKYCGFSVINALSSEKDQIDSNGVGIESICNMMKQMNGICNVELTEASYEMTLLFPIQ